MGRFTRSIGRMVDHVELAPAAAALAASRGPSIVPADLPDPILENVPERDITSLSPLAGLDDLARPARFGVNGFVVPVVRDVLTEISDDRRFSGSPAKVRRVSGLGASFQAAPKARSASTAPIYFRAPQFVLPCIRRKARREAIFATGKHGGGHKRPRRNRFSFVRC